MLPYRSRLSQLAGLTAALAVAATVGGCSVINKGHNTTQYGSAPYLQGSGKVVSETRELETFTAISVEAPLTVTVEKGNPSAKVTADDNLVPVITTNVNAGTLILAISRSVSSENQMAIVVTAPSIDTIIQAGASSVDAEHLQADALTVSVAAASTLHAGGKATSLDLTVTAGSTADLRNVETQAATVHVTAGSTAHANASKSATGECTTGSTAILHGHPASMAVVADVSSTVKQE